MNFFEPICTLYKWCPHMWTLRMKGLIQFTLYSTKLKETTTL